MMKNGNEHRPLPDGWRWTSLEDCVEILDRYRVPVNSRERALRIDGKQEAELFPYYGATGQVGWIDDYIFDEELVLLGEDGAPFLDADKDVAYLVRGKSWVNNHAHVLRAASPIINNSYLLHYLNTFDFHEYVTGTTRLKLNQSRMKEIPIPIAPSAEQKRIVAEIEKQFTRLDQAVAALRRLQNHLARYKASVLKAACEGRLVPQDPNDEPAAHLLSRILAERRAQWQAANPGKKYREPQGVDTADLPKLPEGWVWTTMPQIGELNRGKSKHRPRDDARLYGGPYPFIQTGDVRRSDGFVRTYTQTYSEFGLAQSRLWPKGTLCITIAANIAETAILSFDACFPDSIVGFFPTEGACDVRFVEFFMRTAKSRLEEFAPATAQKNINLQTLSELAIPLPPLAEQKRIVAEVERRLSVAAATEQAIQTSLTRAERLRQSILHRAFTGRLVPQQPEAIPSPSP